MKDKGTTTEGNLSNKNHHMLLLNEQIKWYTKRLEKLRKEEKYLIAKIQFVEDLIRDHE